MRRLATFAFGVVIGVLALLATIAAIVLGPPRIGISPSHRELLDHDAEWCGV